MKILHAITLADLGGAQSVLINICNRAVQNEHEVFVVSEVNGPMWDQLDDRIIQIKIDELQREINALKDFRTLIKLKKIYSSIKPDIIHLHSSKIGALGRLAFPSRKIVYTVHGFDSIRIANKKFLFIEKALRNYARKIVAVSEYDLNMLAREGIADNTLTIYNGIEDCSNNKFSDGLDQNVERKLQALKKDFFVVMAIARISPQKKFDLFCDIAKTLKNDKRFIFVWVGNGHDKTVNDENIIMLGEVPKASQCFRYADVCVLPTNYEGLPISIIEALAFAIPVVASNVGGVPEILNGQNGFAVNNTVESFVETLKKLKDSSNLYQKISSEARITYAEKFTIVQMSEKYEELYFDIKNKDY